MYLKFNHGQDAQGVVLCTAKTEANLSLSIDIFIELTSSQTSQIDLDILDELNALQSGMLVELVDFFCIRNMSNITIDTQL